MVSPMMPPAPTPPVNNGNMASGSSNDRSATLLNLLKFSNQSQASSASVHLDQQHHSSPSGSIHRQHSGPSGFMHHYGSGSGSNQQSPLSQPPGYPTSHAQPPIMAPAPSAADPSGLLAALMMGARDLDDHQVDDHRPSYIEGAPAPVPAAPEPPASFGHNTAPDTRQYLLNLLNQPKPSQDDQPRSRSLTPQSADTGEPTRAVQPFSGDRHRMPSGPFDFEPRQEYSGPSYSTYKPAEDYERPGRLGQQTSNVFGSYNPSPPQKQENESPKLGSYQILKKPVSVSQSPLGSSGAEPKRHVHESPVLSGEHTHRKREQAMSPDEGPMQRTPTTSESGGHGPEKAKETVSEAVHDIAEKASREAREALARAEEEQNQAEIDRDIEDMMAAKTDEEFKEAAKHAAQAIKKELERPEHRHALEDHLPPEVAEEVRKELDEAAADVAAADVADNWENVDNQDEAVVIEEEPPVKVFNFPVQPWISITMKEDGTEPRPQFRDSCIMDVAKLKKEFDQYDRNLYTATRRYMAYAMSKQGGIHVVRQDDGRDAKIFLNTKERIFNVSMSTTPTDHGGVHREAILATGVNGNVYWVELFHGDKDHIEDTHPEQYGFLLPPLASQDGDTSGGTLKTRARVSSYHPEFFAIGRGKSINIIWPSLIMKNDLFVSGTADRTVDSERLAQLCSLKINTGKAGKDFTFSHDDTVIVSLDKSGRVKFWDVREMTAAKEGSDPNAPLPAETSIELKEPIMNLPSTLEGEKAWPTSVLLLDKIRPYQKRTALRYMIVGMKQNHTLQLWDLALRKPVQEFNLPHSKESDAMCSVTYHPESGIIVIGHPTRNSIYLAHLSAPKYSFKNISQADYIMRLDSKDASLPQPDSTAVISGVREYTLASRGNLRSLDMLCSPAMAQDDDEPTLFELYVMQSKGAICIQVKREDLGWSRENKVIQGVDAVKAKVITVAPLKPLAESADDAAGAKPSRNGKEVSAQAHHTDEPTTTKKGPPNASPIKIQMRKDESVINTTTAMPAAAPSTDKVEKKNRKKKNAAQTTDGQNTAFSSAAAKAAATLPKSGGESSKAPNSQKFAGPSISQEAIEATVKNMEARLSASIKGLVDSAFDNVAKSFDAREHDFDSRQTKLLQVVSDVLNQNVQGVLGEMIERELAASVIPAMAKSMDQVSAKSVQGIQKELSKALPSVTESVMLSPRVINTISQKITEQVVSQMTTEVSQKIQDDVVNALHTNLVPPLTQMTTHTANSIVGEIQQQFQDEFERLNDERRADANKIDQLLNLVTRLSNTVSTMASGQAQFQAEILTKFQRQNAADRSQTSAGLPSHGANFSPRAGISPASNSMQLTHVPHNQAPQPAQAAPQHMPQQFPSHGSKLGLSPAELQIAEQVHAIDQLVHAEKMEEAVIRWLQSGNNAEIFNRYWSKLSPVYLRDLPPLVLLSVATTVSQQLEDEDLNRVRAKVAWLEVSIHSLVASFPTYVGHFPSHRPFHSNSATTVPWSALPKDQVISNLSLVVQDQQVREVTPNIMKLVVKQCEALFMRIQSQDAHDPLLKNLGQLMVASKNILEAATAPMNQQGIRY